MASILAFFLVYVRVHMCPAWPGARDRVRIRMCPQPVVCSQECSGACAPDSWRYSLLARVFRHLSWHLLRGLGLYWCPWWRQVGGRKRGEAARMRRSRRRRKSSTFLLKSRDPHLPGRRESATCSNFFLRAHEIRRPSPCKSSKTGDWNLIAGILPAKKTELTFTICSTWCVLVPSKHIR